MSKKKQIKAKALKLPANRQEAERLLAEIGSDQRSANAIADRNNDKVTAIQLATAEALKPINDGIDAKFQALHAWAEAHRGELLEGDAKSVKLATGTLSWRFTPPSVQIAKGKSEAQLQELLDDRTFEAFVRTTHAINKEAILDAYANGDEEVVESMTYVDIRRTEEFAAQPLDMAQEYTETVKPAKAAKK